MKVIRGPGHALLVVALAAAHFLLRPLLAAWWPAPDLLTGSVLLGALQMRAGAAAGAGFGLGILEGALALTGIGQIALVYTVVGYLAARWREYFFADIRGVLYVYVFIGCWITQLLLALTTDVALTWELTLVRTPVIAAGTTLVCGTLARFTVGTQG